MLQFTQDLQIGVPHIDAQHRSLIDFVNQASEIGSTKSNSEEMKKHLDFLGTYVVKHFSDEEQLQVKSQYPRYQQHKQIHQEFVATFLSLVAEFQKNGASPELSQALIKKVSNWIVTHISREDVAFGQHYAKSKLEHFKSHVFEASGPAESAEEAAPE